MKKVISIIAIIPGGLVLLSVVVPMIMGAILKAQVANSVGIIGGATCKCWSGNGLAKCESNVGFV